ncbi:hypothetical protein V6N12_038918 [Hibiscus sabdariffa]|uniref:Uncharacterized protein n=1 Tax=Hibiscus sabdariffa TaxID=183260 RepID=A0ABR2DZN9_9ROSI
MMQEKDIETTSDSENDESDKDPWRKQSFDSNNFKILNDTLNLSIKGLSEITCALKDDQGKSMKEELVLSNVVTLMTQEATSKVHAIESSLHRLRVVARANELRREDLLAENNLLKFIHFKCDGGNEDGARANELRMEDLLAESNLLKFIHFKCDGGNEDGAGNMKEKPDDENTSKAHWCDNVADGQMMQEKDIETTSNSENDGSDKDPWRKQSFDPNNFKILNDTFYLSIKGTSEITCALKDDQGKSRKEEPILPNVVTLMTQEATSKVHAIQSSLHHLD